MGIPLGCDSQTRLSIKHRAHLFAYIPQSLIDLLILFFCLGRLEARRLGFCLWGLGPAPEVTVFRGGWSVLRVKSKYDPKSYLPRTNHGPKPYEPRTETVRTTDRNRTNHGPPTYVSLSEIAPETTPNYRSYLITTNQMVISPSARSMTFALYFRLS